CFRPIACSYATTAVSRARCPNTTTVRWICCLAGSHRYCRAPSASRCSNRSLDWCHCAGEVDSDRDPRDASAMDVEAQLVQLRGEGKLNEVATLAIESYGPDVLGFLAAILHDQADAGDAFAQACENLWRGLPRFEARSAIKTWFYTLA